MANHVCTYVQFKSISDAGRAKLNDLYARVRKEHNYHWFSDMWDVDTDLSETYVWNCENIGPKWTYIDEKDDDYIRFMSAWEYPEMGLEWLISQIAEVDSSVLALVSYDDEAVSFVGASVFDKDGLVDSAEWSYETLQEGIRNNHPGLQGLNEESDEFQTVWDENIWDYVHELQETFFHEVLSSLPA